MRLPPFLNVVRAALLNEKIRKMQRIPGEVKGTMFIASTAEEAEAQAEAYLARCEPAN